eukprot:m.93167 g.93167  ORF g.93167 m.93167 type:complete len:184 (+) comp21764_c0_seq1:195-746(+)
MDNTCKLWDINSLRCRQTLRGHRDSVNSVEFQRLSNTLVTAGADKKVNLWDARTGLIAHTLVGHNNACNHAVFSYAGDKVVSTDADGVVMGWEMRTNAQLFSVALPTAQPANRACFDASGSFLAIASESGSIYLLETSSGQIVHELTGHTDAVHSAFFDPSGESLISVSADSTYRVWSDGEGR